MLWRKLIRDLGENKGSYLACTIIALMGLIVFTAFSIMADNLTLSQETFYREQDFAHGFIELLSMPQAALSELAQIEGIAQVKGRIVKDVQLYTPEQEESSYLRLVSLDPEQPHRINDVKLLQGRKHRPGNLDLWLDNQFFAANDLRLEDTMDIIVDGQVREVQIAGVGMCPEFVYYLRTATDFLPNPELYGTAFLTPSDMEILFPPCQGQVNDVVFTLLEGADYEKVRRQLEIKLEQYGLVRIYPREDQTSHAMLTQELEGLQAAAKGFPLLFLTIAGVILYITLKRLVEQQRGQIGILKALGYSKGEITRHYLSYALLLGAGGGILGGLIGIAAAVPLTNILLDFFNVPPVYGKISALYFFQGLLLSLTVFLLAGYSGVRGALA
ncbi:MAG: FtsX-like permease family protein, partial [Firmicutes bacterium]|nr:FtsX-like permease family protein [Bacillota bacterium]